MDKKIKFKQIEILLITSICVSLLFKHFHVPGGSLSLILSSSIISMLYFYVGVVFFNGIKIKDLFKKSAYQNLSKARIFGSVLTGVLLSVLWGFSLSY